MNIRRSAEELFANIKSKMKSGSKDEQRVGKATAGPTGDPHANYTPQDKLRGLPYEATVGGKPPRTKEDPEPLPAPPTQEQNKFKKRVPERIPTDLTGVAEELDKRLQ